MNKKSYMKIGILLMVGLFICAGCSAQQGGKYTVEDLDNLAEINSCINITNVRFMMIRTQKNTNINWKKT